MALLNLASWSENQNSSHSAACGSACGAGDKKVSAACGSACGAGDKKVSAACGSACGAGDK